MKFTMLMIIAIQNAVTRIETMVGKWTMMSVNGTPMRLMRMSKKMATLMASSWPMNLMIGSSS